MDCVEINLKKYDYCLPVKLKELKKDLISLEDVMNIMHEYDGDIEQLQEENNELRNGAESDDSEYIEDWLESRNR